MLCNAAQISLRIKVLFIAEARLFREVVLGTVAGAREGLLELWPATVS